jgi:Spy/CpxP family protein refolding chaperone
MKSRLTLVAALLLGLTAAPAIAQGPPGGGMGGRQGFAQRRMQMLLNGITLTKEQQAKVDSIQEAYRGQMPAMTPGERPDSATMARFRELRQKEDADIRAVLTPEQQTIWDRNAANMPQRRPPGGR